MSDPKDELKDAQRELLIRAVDGSLPIEDKPAVERLLENDPNASCELEELLALTSILREHESVFCPDPVELSDFLDTGHDPSGAISEHLDSCNTCREEMNALRGTHGHAIMPADLLKSITAELPRDVAHLRGPKPISWFRPDPESLSSLFPFRWMTVGAAALALLLVFFLYPRYSTMPTVGTSSVSWDHIGNSLPGGLSAAPKPHVAIVLLFKDFETPLPQETIDELYRALGPSQADRERYRVVPPSEWAGILTENNARTADVSALLAAVKARLDGGKVVLVTVRAAGDRYEVHGRLIETDTGRVIAERPGDTASSSELKSKVRHAAYSVLGDNQ
ncbi:MAG: hypothetical protein RDU20_02020 [Desulfomonilaceae bacterium]|nr:hypothetical protein [Desulfomonilaceae bacterium]